MEEAEHRVERGLIDAHGGLLETRLALFVEEDAAKIAKGLEGFHTEAGEGIFGIAREAEEHLSLFEGDLDRVAEMFGVKEEFKGALANRAGQLHEEEGLKPVDIHANEFAVGRLAKEVDDHFAGLRISSRGAL